MQIILNLITIHIYLPCDKSHKNVTFICVFIYEMKCNHITIILNSHTIEIIVERVVFKTIHIQIIMLDKYKKTILFWTQ